MANKLGARKLVDIMGDGKGRLDFALRDALERQNIPFHVHDYWSDGFIRYYVNVKDLRAAQAVLPSLQLLAEDRAE
jgi:hypothetical protein